ncbi:ferredoxin [Streptomyces katrae]|uniref:ferredoxin n=1 Tax=Streptomyces katrae TaxID=68223 RepID=UPI0004BF12AA|nr:ferredoxin [Streptomyces katrae]
MTCYFDPTSVLVADQSLFRGRWSDRHWLNVPGPFYGGETDNCLTGRIVAPRHVLYDGERFGEFVYRQPRTAAETLLVIEAVGDDPWGGYGCDGDEHWTAETVREWWRDRGRVLEHLAAGRSDWESIDASYNQGTAAAVRDFEAYIADGLEQSLRIYLHWLLERRSPTENATLPSL